MLLICLQLLLTLFQLAVVEGNSGCPFTDKIVCLKWDSELKHNKLQTELQNVLNEIAALKVSLKQKDEKIRKLEKQTAEKDKIIEKEIASVRTQLYNQKWSLKRVNMVLPKMTKLHLSGPTPTITESFPWLLPKGTHAIIVSVYVHAMAINYHNARIRGSIGQRGNTNGAAPFYHERNSIHPNAFSHDLFVPWNSDGKNEIGLKIIESRNNNPNYWLTFKVTGYVTM